MTTKTRRAPAALPHVPSVTVELDRPRRLVYTFASMSRAKQSIGSHAPSFEGDDGVLQLPGFIWACLAPEDQDLTVEEIGNLLTPAMIEPVVVKIGELITASVPKAAEGNVPAPAAKARR